MPTAPTMKKSILLATLLLGLAGTVFAQGPPNVQQPDCVVNVNLPNINGGSGTTIAIPSTAGFDNRFSACQSWTFSYQATANSGTFTSISVQTAAGQAAAGSFAANLAVTLGINPNTNQSNATATLTTGCVASTPCTTPNSWVRILLTRNNFVGAINGILYGYKSGYPGGGGSGGGGGGGCTSPCPVVGTATAGSPPSGAPVQVAGQDGTNIQPLRTDINGRLSQQGDNTAQADGLTNAPTVPVFGGTLTSRTPVMPYYFNGTTWDRIRGNAAGGLFVQGPIASAAANGGNPLKIGGPFNTTQPTVTNGQIVDAQFSARGSLLVAPGVEGFPISSTPPGTATAQTDGATNTPVVPTYTAGAAGNTPILPYAFNGATWDRQFVCTNQAPITISAGTDVVIIAGVSSTAIRICHIDFASDTTATFTIRQGTGTTCGTNTATLAGAYPNATTFAMDYQPTAALRTTVTARDVCLHVSTAATVGGVVVYAQY